MKSITKYIFKNQKYYLSKPSNIFTKGVTKTGEKFVQTIIEEKKMIS